LLFLVNGQSKNIIIYEKTHIKPYFACLL